MTISRNRANGKRYEGELVKLLRGISLDARLGRSNEEGDIILSKFDIIIEAKSTKNAKYNIRKALEQYNRLRKLHAEVWYAIRYKGRGIAGWRLYPMPPKPIMLHPTEGMTLREFALIKEVDAL